MHAFDERLGRAGKVWLGLMVCLSAVCSAFAAPRLDMPSEGISLGEVSVGVEAVGRIGLRNVGDAAVSVSGVKACCGARAELSATVIPPAGSAVLTVSLAPQEVGAFSKTVRILCDDPERPVLSVPVGGVAVAAAGAAAPRRPCEGFVQAAVAVVLGFGAAFLAWKGRRSFSARRGLEGLCRVGLGGLFAYAGAMKLCDVHAFAALIARYEMLPDFAPPLLAVVLPPAECIAGLGLVFSRRVRLFAGAVAVLLVVFLVALSQAALRGLDVSCGCFGGVSSGALGPAIVRDVLLLAVSLWLFLDSSRHLEVQ